MPKACPTCRNLFNFGAVCPNDGTVLLEIPELDPKTPDAPATEPAQAPPAQAPPLQPAPTQAQPAAPVPPPKMGTSHPGRAILGGVVVAVAFVEIWAWAAGGLGTRPTYLAVAMAIGVALAMDLLGHVGGTRFAVIAAVITALGCGAGDVLASCFFTAHATGATPISTLSGLPSILKFGVVDGLTFAVAVVVAFLGVHTGFGAIAKRSKTGGGPQAR